MAEESKRQKLNELLEAWVKAKINTSNIGRQDKELVKLKSHDFMQYNFNHFAGSQTKDTLMNQSINNEPILLLLTTSMNKIGDPLREDKKLIDERSFNYPNIGPNEIKENVKLSFNTEKIEESEKTKSHSHGVNIGLGASAFGVDLKVGYEATWNVVNRQREENHNGQGTEVNVPVVIPPGGATYIFRYQRSSILQEYSLDLMLRGWIEVLFSSKHQIKFENKIFFKTKERINVGHRNKVLISIVDIFKDLQAQGKFPDASEWKFDMNKNIVSYRDKVKVFQNFSADIEAICEAKANQNIVATKPDEPIADSLEASANKEESFNLLEAGESITGISLSHDTATGKMYDAVVKKIKNGASYDSTYALLLDTLKDAKDEDLKKFIKEEMVAVRNKQANPNMLAFFNVLKEGGDKLKNLPKNLQFVDTRTDVYVRDKEEKAEKQSMSNIPSNNKN